MLDWETLIYMQRNIQPFNIVVLQDSPLTPKLLQNKTNMIFIHEKNGKTYFRKWYQIFGQPHSVENMKIKGNVFCFHTVKQEF